MTIVKREAFSSTQASNGLLNITQPKVYKSYEGKSAPEPHVSEVVPNQLPASDEPTSETAETQSEVNSTTSEQTVENGESKTAAEKRAERRDAFKQADAAYKRAIQMQKDAQEKLAKAEQFAKIAEKAKENPVAVAEALGMDPAEFLRKYQNQIFNIKDDEPQVSPEEQVKKQLEQYQKERELERQQLAQTQSQLIRSTYISSKILPELKQPGKYEILEFNNIEASAEFIYDIMNDHFQKTGEELSVQEVAEEMETHLAKELEEKLLKTKSIKKFSKHFQAEQAAQAEQLGEENVEKSKTAVVSKPTTRTLSDKLPSVPPNPALENAKKNYGYDRQSRLKRVLEKFDK